MVKQLEEHNAAAVAAITQTQHHDNVSTADGDGYMEKDSLCTSQSTITNADRDNTFISRSQLRKLLKAEIRKLLVTNL